MKNTTFQRAFVSLSHPVSIGALIILLLNDHWWRQVAPSWVTGKIGDFTWLIFAPFLLAAILAWLMPLRLKHREEIIGRGSIVVVGLVFAFAKTIPAFHSLTIQVLETLTGWGNVLRMDPTDLVALPALMIAWLIWERSANRSIRLPHRGWVLIPLAVLATMADSPTPNSGISCVKTQADSTLIANDAYLAFVSHDGGATWSGNPEDANLVVTPGLCSYADATHGFVWDGGSNLYYTYVRTDGSLYWGGLGTSLDLSGRLSELDFVPGGIGWALTSVDDTGHSQLYRSEDGGANWSPLIP